MTPSLHAFLLVVCLWATWSSTANAQSIAQRNADSLQRLIVPAVDDTLKVRRLTELAGTLTNAGKYDSALVAANLAQKLATQLKDTIGLADALLGKGRVLNFQGQYTQALEYCLKGLKNYETLGDKRGLVKSLNNIGILYYFQSKYSLALQHYQKALNIAQGLGDIRSISSCLLNIGDIYLYDGQQRYRLALESYQKSWVLKQQIGDKRGLSIATICVGNTFAAMNQADSALLYHNQGLRIAKEIENPKCVADAQYAIASILTKQNKYSQALPKAQEALQIRKELGELKEQSSTQALLATIHAALGNYKAAYAAQSEYHALKDSLFNADNAKRLSALQANYDAQKQAAEQKFREAEARHKAELATQEKERQTQLQYAAIAGVVLFVLALALASRRVSTESSWGRRFGRFVSFAAVVMLVEFAILFLDPWLDRFTGGIPLWRMAANVCIAVVVTPVHGLMEAHLRKQATTLSPSDS
ncbi:MAG: tetratricopeptide repeat protein [Candidatus Kapaibacteriota bacterium]